MAAARRERDPGRYPPPFQFAFLHPRFWPTWLGFALLWLLSYLPQRVRVWLARVLGRLAMRRSAKRREIVQTNLAWCFPELDAAARERLTVDTFRYLFQAMLDTGLAWWGSERRFRRSVAVSGGEALAAALQRGEPVIVVTCHTPAMGQGGMALSTELTFQTFVNPARNPLVEWMSVRGRARFGGRVFPRSGGLRPVVRALREGIALYILTDEDLGPRGSVFAPFFGIPRATLTTPARLARMTGATVFTALTHFDDAAGRYVVKVAAPLEGFPEGDEVADATRLNRALESGIREAPAQYMWTLRIFKTRPDGSPPPYTMKGNPASGPRPRPER